MINRTDILIGIIGVVLGILVLIYPKLVSYAIGFFLVIFGVLKIIK